MAEITESAPLGATGRNFRARLIEGPRWGSSGFYSEETLRQAANDRIFHEGMKMYIDHPSLTEKDDRPERSVRDIAGYIATDAVWENDGLYANVHVYPHMAPVVEAMAGQIGLSIRAMGEAAQGEAEGRKGLLVNKLTEGISVDYVTEAGAGGKLTALLESARENAPQFNEGGHIEGDVSAPVMLHEREIIAHPDGTFSQVAETQTVPAFEQDETTQSTEELNMDELTEANKALSEARDQVAALETERDTLTQRAEQAEAEIAKRDLLDQAATIAKEAVAELPEVMADRIVAEAMRDLPRTDEGALDTDKFGTDLTSAIEAEKKYAEALAPQGVTGFGASTAPAGVTESDVDKAIARAFGREIKGA